MSKYRRAVTSHGMKGIAAFLYAGSRAINRF